MKLFRNLIEVGKDSLWIEFPPKSKKVRKDFLDESLKKKAVYEDVALKHREPEKTKLHIRDRLKGLGYTILHGELDYWDIKFGKGLIFKDMEPKSFVISFKGMKAHDSSRTLGYAAAVAGMLTFAVLAILSVMYSSMAAALLGYFLASAMVALGYWIAKPLTLWIKGTGIIAQKLEGNGVQSSQLFQLCGSCGFQGMGKINTLREDLDSAFKNIVEFVGETKER